MRGRRSLLRVAHAVRKTWWRLAGPKTLGIRGVVFDEHGRVLLVRHTYGESWWHLPGGGVKRRESLAGACVRELSEEVGIVVEDGEDGLEQFGTYSNLAEGKSDHVTVFIVRRWTRQHRDDDEIAESGFFALDEPPKVSPGTGRRLAELADGRPRSFRW